MNPSPNGSSTDVASPAAVSAATAARDHDGGELPVLDLVNALLRRRRLVAWTAAVVTLLAVAPTIVNFALNRRMFRSEALLTATGRRAPSSLSGLAAQFGVAIPGTDATQSPAFYVDLVKSYELLSRLAISHVRPAGRADSLLLAEHYDVDETDPAERREEVRKLLARRVEAASSQRSGVITIAVNDRDRDVARQIAEQLIAQMSAFNIANRRSQATAERAFTERRTAEARSELRAAEERVREFYARNRDFSGSPDLKLAVERLERDVSMRQEVYSTVAQAYEQARIEEVRDTPVLTVIQAPFAPARPEPSGIVGKAAIGLIVGLGLGALAVFLVEFASGLRRHDPERFAEFQALSASTARQLRRPWHLLGR